MDAQFDFRNNVVLIAGGSRGLGLAMVRAFSTRGADVVIASRKLESCLKAAAEIKATGRRALAVACHVGEWDQLDSLVEQAYAAFGKVDVLINNAGMSPVAPSSLETPGSLIDKVLAVNFKGPFRLSAAIDSRWPPARAAA